MKKSASVEPCLLSISIQCPRVILEETAEQLKKLAFQLHEIKEAYCLILGKIDEKSLKKVYKIAGQANVQVLPASHLARMRKTGFEAVTYFGRNVMVDTFETEGLPRHLVGDNGKKLIIWETDDHYSFPGWQVYSGSTPGGRYDSIHSALGWFEWLEDQKAA